jgi:hypothetical protein
MAYVIFRLGSHMGEMRNAYNILSGSPTKIGYLKDLVANGKTVGSETINKVLLVNFSNAR